MATEQPNVEALKSATPTPIAELSPELTELSLRAIDGSVTITWPFSASKRLLAFVLADHDFRKRRNKGQLRLEFHGAAGRALDKAKIASGDAVRLSLYGAEWQEQGSQPGLTGEPLGWQLKFSQKLLLCFRRLDSLSDESVVVDGEVDEEVDEEEPIPSIDNDALLHSAYDLPGKAQNEPIAPQTPLMNVSTKRLASAAFDDIEEYVSPAFLKRAKVSYGSLFEGGFEAMEEESSRHNKKGRRKSRFSMPTAAWRYSSRSPSPTPAPERAEEVEEDTGSDADDEVPVPGFSFKAKSTISKIPELRAAMVDESIQTQDTRAELLSITHQDSHISVEPEKDVPIQTVPEDQQPAVGVNLTENALPSFRDDSMSASLEEPPVAAAEILPQPSPVSQNFGFELGSAGTISFEGSGGQGRPGLPMSSSTAPGFPLSSSLHSNSLFSVAAEAHTQPASETISEHQIQAQDQDVLMDEAEKHQSDVEDLPSVSSPGSRAASAVSERQPPPVETIEIPSSSPVQSPQAPPAYHAAPPPEYWSLENDAEAEVDAASEEGIVYDDEYDDEDAEGSEEDENEWTHDATPNDDREVPGEDYDLRKYDDAHEDDEEGNIDRDSLLSTDGEGNVVPANPAVVSASSSDYEEEGAALDVDDDVGEDEVDMVEADDPVAVPEFEAAVNVPEHEGDGEEQPAEVYLSGISDLDPGLDSADEVTPSENEEEEGQEYDEEDYGEEGEEEEYEEDDEDDENEAPGPIKSQEPVFIDLLSDSDEEGGDERGRIEKDENEYEEEEVVEEEEAEEEAEHLVDAHELDDADKPGVVETPLAGDDAFEASELAQEPAPSRDPSMQDDPTALPVIEDEPHPLELPDTSDHQELVAPTDPEPDTTLEQGTPTIEDKSQVPAIDIDGEEAVSSHGDVMLVDEEPPQQQASFPSASEDEHDNNVQIVSEREHDADSMVLDSGTQAGASPNSAKPASEVDSISLSLSAPAEAELHDTSSASLVQESMPVLQSEVTETLYQSQPPPSSEDIGLSQSSFPTQTVIASQTQPEIVEEAAHAGSPEKSIIAKGVKEDSQVEPQVQQLITPSETQQAELLDNAREGQEAAANREHSPGPNEQLFLEMRQYETELRPDANADANQAPFAQGSTDLVTEEDDIAKIEDKAEHDPTLEQKDYIITTDSLRSHDHVEDEAAADALSQDETQTTIANAAKGGDADEQETAGQLRVPTRRSHRKTRSSGSVDLSTRDGDEIASQESATQQLSQPHTFSHEMETSQTPIKLRTSGRKKAVQELNVNAANTLRDSGPASATRGPRVSPRGHKRGTDSDAAAEQDTPMAPSVEKSPKAERLSSNKSQLLRMLQSDLPEFLPLRVLRNSLHKTVDIMAIAAVTPSASVRPKNGPRDYMLELILTDPSTAPSTVSVAQIYRPHQKSLPIVKAGDVILLRRFQVLSMKGRGFGIRAGDDSAWAVFEKQDEEKLPQITGPPVEVTEEEVMYVMNLAGWWEGMGEDAWKKAEEAGEKAKTL